MKKLSFPITIMAICMMLVSCGKEPIPEPTDLPKTSEAKPLYIKTEVSGELLNYEVNGEDVNAESEYVKAGFRTPPHWGFGIFTSKDAYNPTFTFTLANYSDENGEVKANLDKTLEGETLEFMYFLDPEQNDLGKITIGYFDGINPPISTYSVENDDLTVTHLTDTLVDDKPFRILEVKGQLKLRESPFVTEFIEFRNFEARMALRLE